MFQVQYFCVEQEGSGFVELQSPAGLVRIDHPAALELWGLIKRVGVGGFIADADIERCRALGVTTFELRSFFLEEIGLLSPSGYWDRPRQIELISPPDYRVVLEPSFLEGLGLVPAERDSLQEDKPSLTVCVAPLDDSKTVFGTLLAKAPRGKPRYILTCTQHEDWLQIDPLWAHTWFVPCYRCCAITAHIQRPKPDSRPFLNSSTNVGLVIASHLKRLFCLDACEKSTEALKCGRHYDLARFRSTSFTPRRIGGCACGPSSYGQVD